MMILKIIHLYLYDMLNSNMTCLNNINTHRWPYEPLRNVFGGKIGLNSFVLLTVMVVLLAQVMDIKYWVTSWNALLQKEKKAKNQRNAQLHPPSPQKKWLLVKTQKPFEVLNEKLNPCNVILCLPLNIHLNKWWIAHMITHVYI